MTQQLKTYGRNLRSFYNTENIPIKTLRQKGSYLWISMEIRKLLIRLDRRHKETKKTGTDEP